MTKIKTESEFRFEFRAYCEGVARHHAEDDIQELLSLEADRPERSAKALRKFYKKEADKILEVERYRQAKRNVSALPFDMAFDAIETPATVAAFEENHTALFWKLEETPTFSYFIYLERKQNVLAWIGERLKALKESDRPVGVIPTDDKAAPATVSPQPEFSLPADDPAGPATGEPVNPSAAKVSIDGKEGPAKKRERAKTLRTIWVHWYLQHYGDNETPLKEKDTIDEGLEKIANDNGFSFPNARNWYYKICRPDFRRAESNIKHLEFVISKLSAYPEALESASDELRIAKAKSKSKL